MEPAGVSKKKMKMLGIGGAGYGSTFRDRRVALDRLQVFFFLAV